MKLFRTEDPQLDATIAAVYSKLNTLDPVSDEYAKAMQRLTELNALKNQGLDPTKLVIAAANLFVALKVLDYEETNVITTKLFSFMQKF